MSWTLHRDFTDVVTVDPAPPAVTAEYASASHMRSGVQSRAFRLVALARDAAGAPLVAPAGTMTVAIWEVIGDRKIATGVSVPLAFDVTVDLSLKPGLYVFQVTSWVGLAGTIAAVGLWIAVV